LCKILEKTKQSPKTKAIDICRKAAMRDWPSPRLSEFLKSPSIQSTSWSALHLQQTGQSLKGLQEHLTERAGARQKRAGTRGKKGPCGSETSEREPLGSFIPLSPRKRLWSTFMQDDIPAWDPGEDSVASKLTYPRLIMNVTLGVTDIFWSERRQGL
jgi:hypothetical protein